MAERNDKIAKLQGNKQQQEYKAVKGDLVDEMIAKYLAGIDCPVPFRRLGNGYYLFGLRKIFAKILNGKLVIRVGGGYMVIEEFIATYAEQELAKLQKICQREGVQSMQELDLQEIYENQGKSPTKRATMLGQTGSAGNLHDTSPRPGSPKDAKKRGTVIGSLTGTARSKAITPADIERIKKNPGAGRIL